MSATRYLKRGVMRVWPCAILLAVLASAACDAHHGAFRESRTLTPTRAAAVEGGVRAFMRTVAQDVTQEGPSAWSKHFADDPEFFMADEGRLVFPSRAAAAAAIANLGLSIKQIELRWGDDLRVDPLTAELAGVAASYREVRVDPAGHRVEENGFFTGTAEFRDGRWQFRNAHWSVAAPAPTAP
jgi:hypothetical protein